MQITTRLDEIWANGPVYEERFDMSYDEQYGPGADDADVLASMDPEAMIDLIDKQDTELAALRERVAATERITQDMHEWHTSGCHRAPFEFCNQPVCKFARELATAEGGE